MSDKPTIPPEQIERNKSFVPSSERSEEVQAIVDRMPTKGATFVAYVVIVLVAVVLFRSLRPAHLSAYLCVL